jgi:hypothetical protein
MGRHNNISHLNATCFRRHCKYRKEKPLCMICKKDVWARGLCRKHYEIERKSEKEAVK